MFKFYVYGRKICYKKCVDCVEIWWKDRKKFQELLIK